jgi:hypothetical protein
MIAVGVFLAFGVGCLIAAVVVLREAKKMAVAPPPPTFSMDEAYAWVVQHLPDIVAATLTPADVRRILGFQIEYFERRGVAKNGSHQNVPGEVIVGGPETVDFILERCRATGEEYLPEQIYPVVETQLAYLRAIGAIGPARRAPKPDSE